LLNLKKNVNQEVSRCNPSRIFFFDESRFGTHSKIGYGWFERGARPQVPFKLGYKNFYLYSSVDAKDGSNFSLILPKVDTDHMNVFLSELSKEYSSDKIALIMDGAGWHKSKTLKIPSNIVIFHLPPYSPELNPVERLWLYIKNNILVNKIYESLEDLEVVICDFMKELQDDVVKSICTAPYLNI
jgi:transposase